MKRCRGPAKCLSRRHGAGVHHWCRTDGRHTDGVAARRAHPPREPDRCAPRRWAVRERPVGACASARQALVVTQIAMALMLLTGAGLLLTSFRELLAINPGFDPHGVLTARVNMPGVAATRTMPRAGASSTRALARLRALPGVESVGGHQLHSFRRRLQSPGALPRRLRAASRRVRSLAVAGVAATPGYFEAMNIRIVEGRGFDDRDITEGRPVIVDRPASGAALLARGAAPLAGGCGGHPQPKRFGIPSSAPHFDVVGIVESVQLRGVARIRGSNRRVLVPACAEDGRRRGISSSAASGEPDGLVEPIRRAIAEVDPELPIFDIRRHGGAHQPIVGASPHADGPDARLWLPRAPAGAVPSASTGCSRHLSSSGRARSGFGWPLAATGWRSSSSCCAKAP